MLLSVRTSHFIPIHFNMISLPLDIRVLFRKKKALKLMYIFFSFQRYLILHMKFEVSRISFLRVTPLQHSSQKKLINFPQMEKLEASHAYLKPKFYSNRGHCTSYAGWLEILFSRAMTEYWPQLLAFFVLQWSCFRIKTNSTTLQWSFVNFLSESVAHFSFFHSHWIDFSLLPVHGVQS